MTYQVERNYHRIELDLFKLFVLCEIGMKF